MKKNYKKGDTVYFEGTDGIESSVVLSVSVDGMLLLENGLMLEPKYTLSPRNQYVREYIREQKEIEAAQAEELKLYSHSVSAKVGDVVYYEMYHSLDCKDVTIGSAIVREVTDESFIGDTGVIINYKQYVTDDGMSAIEDYNCIPADDPRVVAYIEESKRLADDRDTELRKFVFGDRTPTKEELDIVERTKLYIINTRFYEKENY